MDDRTRLTPVKLPNNSTIFIEATILSAEQDVSFTVKDFAEITGALEGIATAVGSAIERVKPKKASVELGLEVGLEAGQLTALLVKGSGKANLKVTLSWES